MDAIGGDGTKGWRPDDGASSPPQPRADTPPPTPLRLGGWMGGGPAAFGVSDTAEGRRSPVTDEDDVHRAWLVTLPEDTLPFREGDALHLLHHLFLHHHHLLKGGLVGSLRFSKLVLKVDLHSLHSFFQYS